MFKYYDLDKYFLEISNWLLMFIVINFVILVNLNCCCRMIFIFMFMDCIIF